MAYVNTSCSLTLESEWSPQKTVAIGSDTCHQSVVGFMAFGGLPSVKGRIDVTIHTVIFLKSTMCQIVIIFGKKGEQMRCDHCGKDGVFVSCNARKIWEFEDSRRTVTVYHYGSHSCSLLLPREETRADQKIKEMFRKNPKLKPSQMPINCVVEAIADGKDWNEIDSVSDSVVNDQRNRNLKKKAVSEANPQGHSFEAIGILKAKTDERDKFLIHKVNDRRLNGNPSFVFKTSTFKAKLAMSMDRNGDKLLSREYCHFDGKVNRCPGYTTLTASVYHPTMKRMIKLAVMETEGEAEDNVRIFWEQLDEAIKQVSGDSSSTFNPYGFMCDEAGGIWKSIQNHFPDEVLKNSVSCEFHYLQSVNRHTVHAENDELKRRYKKLAKQLMDSATPSAYFETLNLLDNFIAMRKDGQKHLSNWLRWWDMRRTHWAKAFKCDLSSPSSNLSESVNASYSHRGSCHVTLLRAAYEDTADSILTENQWLKYKEGEKSGGRGPSAATKSDREHAKQKREAVRMAEDLTLLTSDNEVGADAVEVAFREFEIDSSASFEPRKKTSQVNSSRKKRGRPKKKHVSVYDETESEVSSAGEEVSKEKYIAKDKRETRTRVRPSKKFEKSLEKAKSKNIKGQSITHDSAKKSFTVVIKSRNTIERADGKSVIWNTYTCTISKRPSCDRVTALIFWAKKTRLANTSSGR